MVELSDFISIIALIGPDINIFPYTTCLLLMFTLTNVVLASMVKLNDFMPTKALVSLDINIFLCTI